MRSVRDLPIDIAWELALSEALARGEEYGRRANLREVDLGSADLCYADLRGANLYCADLCYADLCYGDLRDADLQGANLRDADLWDADLRNAELWDADLRNANLCGADLRGTDLRNANLCGADLGGADLGGANIANAISSEPVCRMDFGGWSICVRSDTTSIGCQTQANEAWLRWTPADVSEMDEDAEEWWNIHGEAIKGVIRCVQAKSS